MSEELKQYAPALLVLALVLFLVMRARGGSQSAPASGGWYNTVQQIDTQYEAIKANKEVALAQVAGGAYSNLIDYNLGTLKIRTDSDVARMQATYAYNAHLVTSQVSERVARYATDATLKQYELNSALERERIGAAERISGNQMQAQLSAAQIAANAQVQAAKAQASAQKSSSIWSTIAKIGATALMFL